MHEAVACQPRFAGESRRYDQHAKVTLAGARGAAMTGVQVRFVDHVDAQRLQGRRQLGSDRRCQ
jgi:hypothetical protein